MILGTYKYKHAVAVYPVLRLEVLTLRVEVIKATQRKYYVRYLGLHANGAAPNSLHWVKQDKVKLDDASAIVPRDQTQRVERPPVEAREYECAPRLPYKDD